MTTQKLIETYERRLAANWTPDGKKIEKPRRMGVTFADFSQEAVDGYNKAVEAVQNTRSRTLAIFGLSRSKL